MTRSSDVIILGGGIVGAACAFYLAREGIRATTLEAGLLIAGTSRACDGLLLLWDKVNDPEFELARRSVQLWRDLSGELGDASDDALEFTVSGCLALAKDAAQREAMEAIRAKMVRWGIPSEVTWLEPEEISRLEPNVARDLAGALYFPNDLMVDARRATMTLHHRAVSAGARLLDGLGDLRVIAEGDAVKGGAGPGVEYRADCVVVAAGAWTPLVLKPLGIEVGIRPRKGHILVVEKGPQLFRIPLMDTGYVATVESRAEDLQVGLILEGTMHGSILVGASREYVGYDRTINPVAIARLARNMVRFLPALAQRRIIRTYAGLRPASDDRRPFIGPHRAYRGLYVAAGHEGAGITLSLATGRMIADMIVGRETFMDPASFDPAR